MLEPESSLVQAIDSLSANEFQVFVDGIQAAGIFRVSGLAPFRLSVSPSLIKQVRDPVRLTKMVQRDPDLPFNRWVRESTEAQDDIVRPRRMLEIIALDDDREVRRWRLTGAWISEIAYSDFDTGSSELMQETLVLHYDSIDTIWPESAA